MTEGTSVDQSRGSDVATGRPSGSDASTDQSRGSDAATDLSQRTSPTGRSQRTSWLVLPVALVAALLVLLLATRGPVSERSTSSPILGELAPELVGVTAEGDDFRLDDWRGRWVVVNFFSTTCAACVVEHPELVAFQERHAAADDARIVSVVFDDSATSVQEFFNANGGDWPVLAEGAGAAAVAYGVTGVPESYLVAPSGMTVWKYVGGVTADAIDDVIVRLEAQAA